MRLVLFVVMMLLATFRVDAASVVAAMFTVSRVAATPVQSFPTSIALAFETQELVRFCYDRDPEIVYFRYDESAKRTIVEARSLDNRTRALFDFPGFADGRSLSCSSDGATIAALNSDNDHLYIFRSAQLSIYQIDRPPVDNVRGSYSLLSPDGTMIALFGDPVHLTGADAIADMKVFRVKSGDAVFFDEDAAYLDAEHDVTRYQYVDGDWSRQRSITKPIGYGALEVSRCGDRLVASLSDDEHLKLLDPERTEAGRDDWLKRAGVRALLANYFDHIQIDGDYRHCVMPLYRKEDFRKRLKGIVTFDHREMRKFDVGRDQFTISANDFSISKDSCLVLFSAFEGMPEMPQFTMKQHAVVLRLGRPECGNVPGR